MGMDRWMVGWIDLYMDGWVDKELGRCKNRRIVRWIGRLTDR